MIKRLPQDEAASFAGKSGTGSVAGKNGKK